MALRGPALWDAIGAMLLLVLGLLAGIVSTYYNIQSLISEPVKYLPWCPLTGVEQAPTVLMATNGHQWKK